jgi:hypothetical protein
VRRSRDWKYARISTERSVAAELYLVKNKKTGFEDKVGLHSDVDGPLAFIMSLLDSRGGPSKFGA